MAWCSTVIEAPGVVERFEGHRAWIRVTEVQGGCGRCHEPGGCGGAPVAHAFGRPNTVFQVETRETVQPGQAVTLVADEGAALMAALTSYGVPTALVLVLVALGTWFAGDSGALLGLIIAIPVSVWLIRHMTHRRQWKSRMRISIRTHGACALDH